MRWRLLGLLFLFSLSIQAEEADNSPKATSFTVDYDNQQFLLDGQPFRYISGSFHYFRTHPDQWADRLKKVRALGLNAIQFYIPWNFHEFEQGVYNFNGSRDVVKFIQMARDAGLYSIVRLGPYVCTEWENGGLPYWLLKITNIKQRTNDALYLNEVIKWWANLLPRLKPLLRENGGPILMLQIENEYGSFEACDHNYMAFLRDLVINLLGNKILMYTTDGNGDNYLKCGAVSGVLPTVDFGPDTFDKVNASFTVQRKYMPNGKGPAVNSEFYSGWLVLWGQKFDLPVDAAEIVTTSQLMWDLGASWNIYMLVGGTNFGFWNGAEYDAPVITSYDYYSPITEAGDCNYNYRGLRDWFQTLPANKWTNRPQPIPPDSKKITPLNVTLSLVSAATVTAAFNATTTCTPSDMPKTFEDLNQGTGFVIYRTTLTQCGSSVMVPDYKDFAYVYLNGVFQDFLYSHLYGESVHDTTLNNCQAGGTLDIVAENQGRLTYETINDYKGLFLPVLVDGQELGNFQNCPLKLDALVGNLNSRLEAGIVEDDPSTKDAPAPFTIFSGTFNVDEPADAWVNLTGWGKGLVYINGENLGRFWEYGPQASLYLPAPLLNKGSNKLTVVVFYGPLADCTRGTCSVALTNRPDYDPFSRRADIEGEAPVSEAFAVSQHGVRLPRPKPIRSRRRSPKTLDV